MPHQCLSASRSRYFAHLHRIRISKAKFQDFLTVFDTEISGLCGVGECGSLCSAHHTAIRGHLAQLAVPPLVSTALTWLNGATQQRVADLWITTGRFALNTLATFSERS